MQDDNPSPYKFLDYYTLDDRDIFFGRERETHILLSDVLVSRLVVLFAKTGTGKTSLINAGVRPVLEERGYATFFIRVRADPELSAEIYIKRQAPGVPWEGATLADKLFKVREHLGRPVVLFFDQFEEFFLYTLKDRPERGADFIKNVATLYDNPDSRIHIVFSMREEWFVEMDVFRTPIPKIFHNESNLRLRWFDRTQTFDAISRPARAYNVDVEDELVEELYRDLAVDGLVEPARLQIVCDTLWRETPGQLTIGTEDYRKLGDKHSDEKIATQVLFRRLEEEFERLESERELQLLHALLPLLRTPDGTKHVRDIESLVELIVPRPEGPDAAEAHAAERAALLGLILKLEAARFIRRSKRENQEVIELSHDYLVSDLERLQVRVQAIWPRRRLRSARAEKRLPSLEDFVNISEHAALLTVDEGEATLLLRAALAYGPAIELRHLEIWFHRAFRLKAPVWTLLKKQLRDGRAVETSKLVVDLLSKLAASRQTEGSYDLRTSKRLKARAHLLLERALRQEALVTYTFVILGTVQTEEAVRILTRALGEEVHASNALDALYRIAHSQRSPTASAAAREALSQFHREAIKFNTGLAPLAVESLGRSGSVEAIPLLEEALSHASLSAAAQAALERLSRPAAGDVARDAREALMMFLRRSLEQDATATTAVASLGKVATLEAVELLGRALRRERLTLPAVVALGRLAGSASPDVASAASSLLIKCLGDALERDELEPLEVEALGGVQRVEAVELLAAAVPRPRLASAAGAALERLSRSAVPQVAFEAGAALDELRPAGRAGMISDEPTRGGPGRDRSLDFIRNLLSTGQIIPFLGPGAAQVGRPPGAAWHQHESRFLPTAWEMARFLAEESLFPAEENGESFDVLKVASYYAEVIDPQQLNAQLRRIFDRDYPVGAVHRFLARVKAPLLIFTTSFDDLLERAFREEGRPYDVVFHPAGRAEMMGSILWWRHGEPEPSPVVPTQFFADLNSRTVIYKLFGSVDRISGAWDSYFITEADCVSVLARFTSGTGLPPFFARQLRTRPLLYLGGGLSHWNQRVLLKILKSGPASGRSSAPWEAGAEPTSYTVQRSPRQLEAELWKAKHVQIYDMDLQEFIRRMEETPESEDAR